MTPAESMAATARAKRDADAAAERGKVAALEAENARLRLERDAALAIAFGPVCDACDSEPATTITPDGFHGCDEHRSPGSADLPHAETMRRFQADGGAG